MTQFSSEQRRACAKREGETDSIRRFVEHQEEAPTHCADFKSAGVFAEQGPQGERVLLEDSDGLDVAEILASVAPRRRPP